MSKEYTLADFTATVAFVVYSIRYSNDSLP